MAAMKPEPPAVHREGAFPYTDVLIDGTAYPANEVHLFSRVGSWFVYVEGGHDQSVKREHSGAVFQIVRESGTDAATLVLRCADQLVGWDELGDPWYQCICEKLGSADLQLVDWTGAGSLALWYESTSTLTDSPLAGATAPLADPGPRSSPARTS